MKKLYDKKEYELFARHMRMLRQNIVLAGVSVTSVAELCELHKAFILMQFHKNSTKGEMNE